MDSSTKRSLKGFLLNSFMDFKQTAFIGTLITLAILLVNHLALLSNINSNENIVFQCNTAGVPMYGFITMAITFSIAIFVITNKKEFGRKFVFPLSRNIYAIGNFLFILIGSYALMTIICGIHIIEIIISIISSKIFKNFYLVPIAPLRSFIPGFLITLSYIIFIVSFVYLLSMLFHRYKLITSIIVSVFISLAYFFMDFRILCVNVYSFVFHEPSLIYLFIKLWVLTVVFHLIAYIPLKIREVV